MAGTLIREVIDGSLAKGAAYTVLIVIAEHAQPDGTGAWPSIRTLAREARITDSMVCKALKELQALGELTVEKKKKREDGRGGWDSNRYTVNRRVLRGDEPRPERGGGTERRSVGMLNDVQQGAQPGSVGVANDVEQGTQRRSHEPSHNRKSQPSDNRAREPSRGEPVGGFPPDPPPTALPLTRPAAVAGARADDQQAEVAEAATMAGAEGDDLFTEWHRRWFKAKSAAKPIVLCDACAAILGIDADPAALEALAAIPRDEGGIGGGRGLIAEMDRLRREGTAEERAAFAEVVTAPAAVAAAD